MNVKPATAKISSHALKQNLEIIKQKHQIAKLLLWLKQTPMVTALYSLLQP